MEDIFCKRIESNRNEIMTQNDPDHVFKQFFVKTKAFVKTFPVFGKILLLAFIYGFTELHEY